MCRISAISCRPAAQIEKRKLEELSDAVKKLTVDEDVELDSSERLDKFRQA